MNHLSRIVAFSATVAVFNEAHGQSCLERVQHQVVGPAPTYGHAMVFDSIRDVLVLYGGRDANNIDLGDTWELGPTCAADCDQSTGCGTLDIFDFLCFQNSFLANAPYACDCDTTTGTGVCDIFDLLCFQNAFVAGCN